MPTLPEIYVYSPEWSRTGVMRAWVDAGRGPSRLRVNKPRPYGGVTSGIDVSGTRRDFDGMRLFLEKALNSSQDFGVHCRRYFAGGCVLLAGMIDAKQSDASSRNIRLRAVSERIRCARFAQA